MTDRKIFIGNTRDKISKHFRHYEVVKSYTADRFEIDNFVYDEETYLNAVALGENVLDKIRMHYGRSFSPNSWFRGESLERNICAKNFVRWCEKRNINPDAPDAWFSYFKRKQHPKGGTADIEIIGIDNDALFEWIKMNLNFDQLIREFAKKDDPVSGWVHVSWDRFGANRNEAFSIG